MGDQKERIGLLGGTFDPVHEGHLVIAARAQEACLLDRVIFIPAADPPHKKRPFASYSHRVAMLEMALSSEGALSSDKDFEISLLEAERSSPSYTIDTLIELKNRLGDHCFYFIIGADSLVELPLWFRYKEILCLTNFIVAARPGISDLDINRAVNQLPGPFNPDRSGKKWSRTDGKEIIYLSDVAEEIASTTIRNQLLRGRRPDAVNRRVLAYIAKNHLYRAVIRAEK